MPKSLPKFETLHISRWAAIVASLLILVAPALAQSKRTEHKGPRGIAVVVFAHAPAPDAPPYGPAKLLPVTIFYNGNYYDASIYEAAPAPMAVQEGTVYELDRDGMPLGLYTISMSKQQGDSWYAVGNWQPQLPETAAKEPAKKPGPFVNPASNDERPILKRGGSQPQSANESASAAPSTSSSQSSAPDEDRPILKRPSSAQSNSQSAPDSAAPQNSQQQPGTAAPAYGAEEQDPNRPVLRRGKPQVQPQTEESNSRPVASNPEATRVGHPPSDAAPKGTEAAIYVGVSDTEPSDQRPYKYSWTKEQQTKLTAQMSKQALQKAREYEQQRNLRAGAGWEQSSLRAFDVFTDNDGELIFSGTQDISGPRARKVYVTYAALYDASGELEPLFTDVTDSQQLDVKGRLELIDAVDSTGDGRGDFLFRRVGISTQSFEIYRVTRDGFYKLFTGASAPI